VFVLLLLALAAAQQCYGRRTATQPTLLFNSTYACCFAVPLASCRGDLDLWSRWLRFCQQTGSNRQMSKVLTKALQLHSGCAALWTYAAAWEFEHNLNAAAARALMQRGLRMCKDTPGLWHEYFRMELLYALRLRERRCVLGIAGGDDDIASGPLGGSGESEGEEGGSEGKGAGDESAAAVAAVLNGAVALVVYRSAVAAVPSSVPFRRKFLDMLHPLDFPGKAALEVRSLVSCTQQLSSWRSCSPACLWQLCHAHCVTPVSQSVTRPPTPSPPLSSSCRMLCMTAWLATLAAAPRPGTCAPAATCSPCLPAPPPMRSALWCRRLLRCMNRGCTGLPRQRWRLSCWPSCSSRRQH
jgi:hypothetical protein